MHLAQTKMRATISVKSYAIAQDNHLFLLPAAIAGGNVAQAAGVTARTGSRPQYVWRKFPCLMNDGVRFLNRLLWADMQSSVQQWWAMPGISISGRRIAKVERQQPT